MSQSYPMTKDTLASKLDLFKFRVDRTFVTAADTAANAIPEVKYNKRGGLHFIRIGRYNLSFSKSKR